MQVAVGVRSGLGERSGRDLARDALSAKLRDGCGVEPGGLQRAAFRAHSRSAQRAVGSAATVARAAARPCQRSVVGASGVRLVERLPLRGRRPERPLLAGDPPDQRRDAAAVVHPGDRRAVARAVPVDRDRPHRVAVGAADDSPVGDAHQHREPLGVSEHKLRAQQVPSFPRALIAVVVHSRVRVRDARPAAAGPRVVVGQHVVRHREPGELQRQLRLQGLK